MLLPRWVFPPRSNYATKPIAGGIDANEGGSGIGVVMLCMSSFPRASTRAPPRTDDPVCGCRNGIRPVAICSTILQLSHLTTERESVILAVLGEPGQPGVTRSDTSDSRAL